MSEQKRNLTIGVAGGGGTVGSHVVRVARERGHQPTVLSRSTGVDVHAGTGLADAIEGTDAVIDVTSIAAFSTEESNAFFPVITRNLRAAQRAAGVPHFVSLGIVGAARVDDGYYAGKAEQERILAAESGGWSMLFATQFHEFVAQMAAAGDKGEVQMAPEVRFRPVAASEVAEALVDLLEQEPRGFAGELAGPREEDMQDLMTKWVRAQGSTATVTPFPMPGRFGEGLRDGSILPRPDARTGTITWDQWLESSPTVGGFAT